MPVGSIYQFFPDKAAVVDALAHGYIGEFDAAISRLVDGAEDPGTATGRIRWGGRGRVRDLYRSHSGYVALWSGRHMSAEVARRSTRRTPGDRRGGAAGHGGSRHLPTGPDLPTAQVAVRVANGLLKFAFAVAAWGRGRC